MYKICKTAQSAERQQQFQKTLFFIMEKQPYNSITITALCKEMNAPRKAFYRYFDTLEDVLNAYMDKVLRDAFLYIEVRTDLETFFQYWKSQKAFLDVLEKNSLSQRLADRSFEIILSSRSLEDMTAQDIKYIGCISALITMIITWHHTGMTRSIDEMTQLVREMFVMDRNYD